MKLVGDAGFHPERWADVLELLSQSTGSRGVGIIPLQAQGRGLQHTASLDALAEAYVTSGWATHDLRNRVVPKMMTGRVAVDGDFIDYDEMRSEPYYESFLRPLGFRHFAGFGVTDADEAWAVTLQRGIDDEAFSEDEQHSLARLIRPFADSAKISRMLGAAYHRGSLDQLGRSATACLLLDRLGRSVYLNIAAEAMIGDVFDLRQGRVLVSNDAATKALHARIRSVLESRTAVARPVLVETVTTAHLFEVVRLPDADMSAFAQCRCMVVVRDLRRSVIVDADLIRSVFDMTQSEAALACMLVRSRTLVEAAAGTGVAHETARSQLKSIFAKTRTGSQLELARLLSKLVAG